MADENWSVLADALHHHASAQPERVAFAQRGAELTFAELAERASARGGALQQQGVAPGDRIALSMSAGLPLVEVFWAAQLIGAVPCVFNPFVPGQTLTKRIAAVRPKAVVTDATASEMGAGRDARIITGVGPEDLAFLQPTSGTSGAPRASMIRHRNVIAYERAWRGAVLPDDAYVGWAPPWHDLGLILFVIRPVYFGIRCDIVEPAVRTIPEWLATISRVRGTFSAAPDFALRLATRMVDPAALDLSSLRFMTCGGEPVRWSSIARFEAHFGLPGVVFPGYGLGEATLGVSSHVPGDAIAVDERGNVSCGWPVPGVKVRAGASLDEPEEIRARADTVFAGYFDSPHETDRVLRDGWLHTGDVGYLDDDGRLFVLGRREGMIKRGGGLIAPREIEEAALRAPGVRVAGATSVPHGRDGDDVITIAVEADASAERPAEQIAADISREVVSALGFAPGRVSVQARHTIPRTENGKIRYGRLRELLAHVASSPGGGPSSHDEPL